MAQKSTTRKTLKSLFSRREVNVDEPVEQKDKNEGEKKVFKFLKFKTKKNDPVKPDNENQQLLSADEPSNTAEAGESWADNISTDKKRSSLYGTAPRSKDKGLSYSELDLRKPKRFATFSFGFRKRKKDDEENISKSTVGLHRSGIKEQEETPPDLSQMELDQANTKTRFSMSQPELDTSDTFDIPSPPPMATNQSESYSTLPNQSQSSEAVNAQPEAAEPQTNGSVLSDVYEEPQKAPLATIPELQLDHSDSSGEKENYLVHDDSNASASTTRTETTLAVNNQTIPSLPASQPPTVLDTSDHKAVVVDFVSTSNGPINNDIPQQSDTKAEIALTESTRVALSHPEPDAPDVADGTTQNGKLSLASVDSKIDGVSTSNGPIDDVVLQQSDTKAKIALTESTNVALSHHEPDAPDVADGTTQNGKLSLASVNSKIDGAITESTPVPHAYDTALNSASVHQEVSISRTERSTSESAESVTATSAVSGEKSARPVNQASVYGALYDSLFPQSFTSDVVSSLSNPPPQIRTETRHLNTKSEPVMVVNERHTDTNAVYSRFTSYQTSTASEPQRDPDIYNRYLPSSLNSGYEPLDSYKIPYSDVNRSTSRFTSYQTSTASEPQRDPDIYRRYLPSSLNSGSEAADGDKILDSELTRSLSEVKPDSFSLIKDNDGSVPAVQSSAPPASDDAPSQGEDTQVTDSKRRAILVKESVTDEAGDDPACPSPVPGKMSEEKRIQIRIDTSETFFAPSAQTAEPLSPAYLSVGSDDMEVYYSAEEDNAEESGVEVIHTVDEREESCMVDGAKEAGLREEFLQQVEVAETEIRMRNEAECRGVIVKMQSEGGKMGNEDMREDLNSRIEVEQQAGGQRSVVQEFKTSEFLVGNDAKSQEKVVPLPQLKEEAEKTRKEGEYWGVIVKMQNEVGKMGDAEEYEDLNSRIEVEQQIGGQRSEVQEFKTSEFLVGNDAESQEKEVATTALPEVEEEAKEERKEGEYQGVIVKMQNAGGTMSNAEEKKDLNSRTEVEQQIGGQRSEVHEFKMSEFLVGNDAKSQEKVVPLPQLKEEAEKTRKEGEYRGVIVEMQNEVGKMGDAEEYEDLNSRIEVEQQIGGQRSEVQEFKTSEFLVGNDAESQEKEVATTALPEVEEEAKEERKEGEYQGVIVKMQNDGGTMSNAEEKKDLNSRTEVEQQIGGQRSEVQEFKTSEFLVGNDAKTQEKEVATTALPQVKEEAEEERKEGEPVALVQQVMACVFAPPSSGSHGLGEGSEGNKTKDLETEDPLNGEEQLPSQEILYQTHKATMSSEYVHASSSDTREEVMITPRFREVEEQVSPTAEADQIGDASKETSSSTAANAVTDPSAGAEVVTGALTRSAEPQSDAAEIEHNRARQSSEWVDTITQSTGKTRTTHEQVAVELSAPTADARSPDPEAAETQAERHEHPAEAQPDLDQGSLATSRTPTAASEVFASINQPPEADKESVDKMNSGYSSLSTKLSLKNSSPPKEDESKSRFRKVSLISETNAAEAGQDAVDFSKTSTTISESNGTDIASEYKWRNRFEGVSQYRPYKIENPSISDSPSYRMSDTYSSTTSFSSSSSSALPEASAYKHLSSSSLSSSPPEEHITLSNRLSDMTKVYQSHESEPAEAPRNEWRRSLLDREEPAAPAGEREAQREAESERLESRWDSHQLPVSGSSSAQHQSSRETIYSFQEGDDDDSRFTGVFKATLVELVSEPAALPSTPPASPDADSPIQFDMDSLVDTLKNMGPSLRPRNSSLRGPPPVLMSSLAPIVEDAASPITPDMPPASITSHTKKMEVIGNPPESLKGLYTLPGDLGLKRSSVRDTRSPLELMKQGQQDHQQQPGTRGLTLPLRTSANNSFIMRTSSDSSPEELKSPVLNGNGLLPSPNAGSRLDNSIIFGSHRSTSIDQTLENGKAHRPLLRSGSLPDTGFSNDRMSAGLKELGEKGAGTEPAMSRFERFSFLLNSSPGSLTGSEDPNARMSRSPLMSMGSPPSSNSPTRLLSPTSSIDLQRPFTTTDSPLSMFGQSQGMGMGTGMGTGMGMGVGMGMGTGVLGTPILQRSFSSEGTMGLQQNSMFNSVRGGSQFQSQEVEHERSLVSKYRAFPDAYLTKEKEHGKLNPRPGKMYIFDRPEMCGQRIEVRSDVIDATPWELQETISIRVVRGGWVMYEKPNFKGEKIALDEGDIELTCPFSPPEEEQQLQNGQKEAGEQNGVQNGETSDEQTETTKPARKTVIGSIRRAVRDYSVPEISLFPEENAEGKKVVFRDTSEDARIFGFPIKANSIIINAGLWLVYAHPFFQGIPRVLEVGGYTNPAAWGVEQPYVGSVHPLKVGEPRVENMSEPKMMLYEKPYFTGKSRIITTNMRDFMTRADRQQTAFMYNVGSLKVQGGMWVGYEKEGFRGHQYLLEEGEYHDWRVWGGRDAELRSVRVIRADLTEPMMVMFEQPEEEGIEEENTFEVTEAIADVELFEYKTSTRSIHVLSGAWIAYSHVDYSGNQYILEKGFYNNCADWGSQDTRICSVQPVLLAPSENSRSRNEIILYSEPDFQGECHVFDRNQKDVPEKLLTKSCRVSGGSWVLYENKQYSGDLYVLSDGDYPNLTSMGCPAKCTIGSFKVVPLTFSVPSISLFGLECLEGREITMDTEIHSMVEEGFNNHILSVRVNSGCWVICEHSNYRGRQFLLEPIEITNWPKFSSIQTIGSMFPVRQKRRFLRIKNKESGHFMSIQGGVEEMKSGRVVASPEVEPMSDIWFYQDGFIKSKLSPTMSLQVMGNIEPAAKVVLWQETRQPIQTWTAQMRGLITSLTFPGCVLDVKGGKTYDKDHVVIMPENDERPSQQWAIELL